MRYSFATMLVLFLGPVLCSAPVKAQVVELRGGSSTLFESNGGEVEIKGNTYDASLGAGTIGSHFLGGAKLTRRFESSTLTFGTQNIAFDLPTDIFNAGHSLTTLGGSVRQALPNASILLFGGMMSKNFETPFFQGTMGVEPAAIFLFDGRVRPNLSVATRMILAKQISLIEGVSWRPAGWAQLAASGGIGAGKGYGAVSAKLKYSVAELQTAYIQTSPSFRRSSVDTVLAPESDGLNASLTIAPSRRFTVSMGHSRYLVPVAGSEANTRSSIDQIETNTSLKGISLSASLFRSIYSTGSNTAFAFSGSRAFGPKIKAQGSYLYSTSSEKTVGQGASTTSVIANVSQELNARWSISEILNNTNGQTTLGFGTSFLSNLATVGAEYETYYVPQHLPNAFEQVLILNADLNLNGHATIHGDTFVAPNGGVKHTVSATGTFVKGGDAMPANEREPMERYVMLGRVVDELNRPVEGAALLIDRVPVYTDSDGRFVLRERQSRYHSLQILTGQFLDGGQYMIVNATHNIHSTLPDEAVLATIVVQRVPRVCPHGVPCKT